MKTVSEHQTARAAIRAAEDKAAAEAFADQIAYVDQIDKVANGIVPEAGGLNPAGLSNAVRVESLRHKARTEPLAFVDVACDHCKTALFDRSPHATLTSSPPKFWADCIGCGKSYALTLDMRVRKTF